MKLRMKSVLIVSKILDVDVIEYTRDLAFWLLTHNSSSGPLTM